MCSIYARIWLKKRGNLGKIKVFVTFGYFPGYLALPAPNPGIQRLLHHKNEATADKRLGKRGFPQ